jgi:pimeloyl-ACP methyl ester carboxylesterase
MTMNAKRRRAHDRLAGLPGVRPVRRPVRAGSDEQFDLYYVRTGRKSQHPLVVIPGGPGAASVALYRGFRRRAAADGLDVIMVEHRGVGLSRHDDTGSDLPPDALTIEQVVDDIAAVLDDAGVAKAVLYGTSYGTYLAAGVGVRHPDRVHAMILDSPVLSAADIDAVRAATRRLLWDGEDPETAPLAPKVRKLVDDDVLTPAATQLAAAVYGLAGPTVLQRQLDLLLGQRRWLWSTLGTAARLMFDRKAPYHNEPDLVGRIGYRELNYAAEPDGRPLDPAIAYHEFASGPTDFEAEPFDLVAQMPKFTWPTVVVSGGRDLITPPTVAERVAGLIPGAALISLGTAGHSVLDFRERAALQIIKACYDGTVEHLAIGALDALPAGLPVRALRWSIGAAAILESLLPEIVPRTVRRVTS